MFPDGRMTTLLAVLLVGILSLAGCHSETPAVAIGKPGYYRGPMVPMRKSPANRVTPPAGAPAPAEAPRPLGKGNGMG